MLFYCFWTFVNKLFTYLTCAYCKMCLMWNLRQIIFMWRYLQIFKSALGYLKVFLLVPFWIKLFLVYSWGILVRSEVLPMRYFYERMIWGYLGNLQDSTHVAVWYDKVTLQQVTLSSSSGWVFSRGFVACFIASFRESVSRFPFLWDALLFLLSVLL